MIYEYDGYKVTSDKHQFTLYRKGFKKNPETKELTNEVTYTELGHYPKFDMLIRAAIRNELNSDLVKTLEDINQKIDYVSQQFAGVLK